MAMSRIIQTLAHRRPAIFTFPRLLSAGSDVGIDEGEYSGEYSVGVMLPEEKRCASKEERDDWFHWFLSSSCGGSKAAAAAPTKGSSSCRDPRILYTRPDGFFARLSVQDIEALLKRDEFIYAELGGKIDWTVGAIPWCDEAFKAADEHAK